MNPDRYRDTTSWLGWRCAGVLAAATVLAVAAGVVAADPARAASRTSTTSAKAPSQAMQPTPAPAATGLPTGLRSVPDNVETPWLYEFANRIAASPADADTVDCVRVDGYYSQSDSMQLTRYETVLRSDSSADLTTRRLPVIPHRRFAQVTIGDVDFAKATTRREHAGPGELSFAITGTLPDNEQALFTAIRTVYPPVPGEPDQGVVPLNVFNAIVSTGLYQVPRLAVRVAMLRLIARLPGTRVDAQAQDPLLRLTVAVAMSTSDGEDQTAYFAADTGALLAYTQITRSGYTPAGTTPPHLRAAMLFTQGCRTWTQPSVARWPHNPNRRSHTGAIAWPA